MVVVSPLTLLNLIISGVMEESLKEIRQKGLMQNDYLRIRFVDDACISGIRHWIQDR